MTPSDGPGQVFLQACEAAGIDFFTGVPCSYLSGAFSALAAHPHYVPAPREDLALGLAAGAWLGGRCPAVLMQNSGLGTSLNALQSLLQLYRMPCLLVVSWRGEPAGPHTDAPEHTASGRGQPTSKHADAPEHTASGQAHPTGQHTGVPEHAASGQDQPTGQHADAPEHVASGAQLLKLMRLAEVPYALLSRGDMHAEVVAQVRASLQARKPAALVVRRGVLKGPTLSAASTSPTVPPAALPAAPQVAATGSAHGQCLAHTVQRLMRALPADALVIPSNGLLSREVFAQGDRPHNFYMIGSMGLAAAIGAGLAHAQGDRPVVVLEGDGNTLMGLGSLPLVGTSRPRNLWHVVLNNGVHRSTGGQRSLASAVDFASVAAACGYAHAHRSAADADLASTAEAFFARPGPGLWALHCLAEATQAGRVSVPPPELAARMRRATTSSHPGAVE